MSIQFVSFQSPSPSLRPREKMHEYGASALQLWELVAILMRTGERRAGTSEDVEALSRRLLLDGGLRGLFHETYPGKIAEVFGTYKSHAETIAATAEICKRLNNQYDEFDASEPGAIFKRFKYLQKAKQEQCFVLHVDAKNKCHYQEMVALGGQNKVAVAPKDILRSALWLGARNIILVHNHLGPSQASEADITWTHNTFQLLSEYFQIQLKDHIIIGRDGYFSFQEKSLL